MAKIQKELYGDFDDILSAIYYAAINNSATANMEESSDFKGSESRCAVMVFERYSAIGENRVSLSVTLFQTEGRIFVSAISSGGSRAVIFKLNTIGEENFLDTVRYTINSYSHKKD